MDDGMVWVAVYQYGGLITCIKVVENRKAAEKLFEEFIEECGYSLDEARHLDRYACTDTVMGFMDDRDRHMPEVVIWNVPIIPDDQD